MVKYKNNNIVNRQENQGKDESQSEASKIGASTAFEYIGERLSPFGGLLGLVKFLDLVNFKEIFDKLYLPPSRRPMMGHYNMTYGLIILLFIGFNRVWHFLYVQLDSMICSIFHVEKLPYVTTYWRYVNSLGINQGQSLLLIMSALRERVWHLCNITHKTIHIDIDTTVSTIYGKQQGGRKGHNTKNRGKKGFRSILCFIEETREYFTGKLRKGETMSGEELASLIKTFKKYIPGCVERVILRGDGEFISWESVEVAKEEGFQFIFGNKSCKPIFDQNKWYKVKKKDIIEYNECVYKPTGWREECRFVVMRIPVEKKAKDDSVQLELFDDNNYTYRIFATNMKKRPHKVIREYDKRADCENLIGEAKREGIAAMPSSKFSNNYAYFQIVMLSYNMWRSFKMLVGNSAIKDNPKTEKDAYIKKPNTGNIIDNTVRIARLKLLLIASKVATSGNTTKVKYSKHDSRTDSLFKFYAYLDELRNKAKPWLDKKRWLCNHLSFKGMDQVMAF